MTLSAILFDAPGVLYDRPELGVALQTLLEHYGLKPRHPTIVHNALRAASFDASIGRISLDDYHNAILRVHGLTEEKPLAAGREALRFDATRLNLVDGAAAALRRLRQFEIRLGALANSPYRAADEMAWLVRAGVPADTWAVYLSSCEYGVLAPDSAIMEAAVKGLGEQRGEIALVSGERSFLEYAAEAGLIPISMHYTDPALPVRAKIEDLGQLVALLMLI